ncbi:hypothetical protein K1T71_010464 [Dendrolimus kikuchii]|uniref:Uncharacterized protein n=1 Tax=Dendrolimus kikuchii TaxID=765133 RepID=A0ACC1CRL0_9NEOP|nr:hypothetical protein K1T71_010464 [Dendrolimus kikuchii]
MTKQIYNAKVDGCRTLRVLVAAGASLFDCGSSLGKAILSKSDSSFSGLHESIMSHLCKEFRNCHTGTFEFRFSIQAEETGVEANGIQASGGYSYTGDDGQVYSVRYTADANGFQPQGAHLPTPPPIPAEIARSLQENARDEAAGIFDDGSYRDAKYSPGVIPTRTYQPARYIAPVYRPGYHY